MENKNLQLMPFFKKFTISKYKLLLTIIFLLTVSVRIYYATQQKTLYWDEFHSLGAMFNQNYRILEYPDGLLPENNTLKEYLKDIRNLYFDSGDPQISGTYYTLLRAVLIPRISYTPRKLILFGTLLNCIFFLFSFILMEKLLQLIFPKQNILIAASLFCVALIPSSISFSMFLRPYQMQETCFIGLSYCISLIFIKQEFSKKNFILLSIFSAGAYLALNSSLLFAAIIGFIFGALFLGEYILKKITLTQAFKQCLYFIGALFSGFILAGTLYLKFFNTLINSFNRAKGSLKLPRDILGYLQNYCFQDLLIPILSTAFILFLWSITRCRPYHNIDRKKIAWGAVVLSSLLFSIYADMSSPYYYPRYSISAFPLVFIFLSGILAYIPIKNIQYISLSFIVVWYAYQIRNPKRIDNFESVSNFYSSEHLLYDYKNPENVSHIYGISGSLGYANRNFLRLNAHHIFKKFSNLERLYEQIKQDNPDKFYIIDYRDNKYSKKFPFTIKGFSISRKTEDPYPIYELIRNKN